VHTIIKVGALLNQSSVLWVILAALPAMLALGSVLCFLLIKAEGEAGDATTPAGRKATSFGEGSAMGCVMPSFVSRRPELPWTTLPEGT
jgi:hypothetical protein